MRAREFIGQLDDAQVVEAIRLAETGTSGEIRVFISRRTLGSDDILVRASARFQQLGMTKTRERNGVLLYFMPRERKFAVVGDQGVHAKCPPGFWEDVAVGIRDHLRARRFNEAVVSGVQRVGTLLSEHFPIAPGDRHDLSNEVSRD